MNKIFLIGNLTRDPELRSTTTGVDVTTFTVAVNKKDNDTNYFKVTASMAEIASVSLGLSTVSKIMRIRASGQADRIHPTQKPVALYKWLLSNYAKPGDKILDTHVGSASSLIACHQLGFKYWGFELDEDYYNKALERLNKAKSQVSILDIMTEQTSEQISF